MKRVIVTVPYYRASATIRRAVDSVLNQTHRDLICIVQNDGDDPEPLNQALSGCDDPRLLVVHNTDNRGRYYLDAVAARASWAMADWWMPHDADDWSDSTRVDDLLRQHRAGTYAVLTAHVNHYLDGTEKTVPVKVPGHKSRLRISVHMNGLWRPKAAARLTHPDWRIEYAALMTSAVLLHDKATVLPDASYHRCIQENSLVTSPQTGHGSPYRIQQRERLRALWRSVSAAETLRGSMRTIRADIPRELRHSVAHSAAELAAHIRRTVL